MARYSRPNPDEWRTESVAFEKEFEYGEMRIELWTCDGDQQWVLVIDDGGHSGKNEHTPLSDATMAKMLRVMNAGSDGEPSGSADVREV